MFEVIMPSVVNGIFSVIVAILGRWSPSKENETTRQTITHPTNFSGHRPLRSTTQVAAPFSFRKVVLNVGIIQLWVSTIAIVSKYIVNFAMEVEDIQKTQNIWTVVTVMAFLIGVPAYIVGFIWLEALTNKSMRWKYLISVAIGIIIVRWVAYFSLPHLLLHHSSLSSCLSLHRFTLHCLPLPPYFEQIAFTPVQVFLAMVIAAAIVQYIKQSKNHPRTTAN